MNWNDANKRAELSGKARSILDARTLNNSHRRLAEIVTEGMTVLDMGCGTGAITKDIAALVGPSGRVVGMDNNEALIKQARESYGHIPNLAFHTGSIYETKYEETFDIVSSARVLQWLAEPGEAISAMKKAVKPGGKLIILDYNHEKIAWNPTPPIAMQDFYQQFLNWRSDAGMDNTIADRLVDLFESAGLSTISITEQHEIADRNIENKAKLHTWADVIASRGLQMVEDGYISEEERHTAEETFRKWLEEDAISQTMYLLAVEGTKAK